MADIARRAILRSTEGSMAGWIEASVSRLECGNGNHRAVHATFSGDNDMVTMGIASLSSAAAEEIVVAELLPIELGDETGQAFEKRINQFLERTDLRYVRLLRTEEVASAMGTSFADFRAAYRQRRLIFECPRCAADAVSVSTEGLAEFQQTGGKVTNLTETELRG